MSCGNPECPGHDRDDIVCTEWYLRERLGIEVGETYLYTYTPEALK
jgi:hypothetical protein